MDFDADAVETEVRAVFDGYEAALGMNDVAALTAYFWQSPRAVRLMTDGGLYGIEAIAAFRGALERAGLRATVRLTRGRDIEAACGQLAAREAAKVAG